MRIFIDASYYAYYFGYHANTDNPYQFIENIIGSNVFIAMDSKISIRRNSLPWYKANRKDPVHDYALAGTCTKYCKGCISEAYKERVDKILDGLYERYTNNILVKEGYEADDIIAQNVMPSDMCFVNDKDYLTIHTRARLMDFKYTEMTVARFKCEIPLKRGNSALAFQLLRGDTVDNIPCLLKRDKAGMKRILESSNPLLAAIEYVGEANAISSLCALALPTPLLECDKDIITCVLERHPGYD